MGQGCCDVMTESQRVLEHKQRRVLWIVLSLNAVMFFVEFIGGWIVASTALMADSLDMLADAAVYGVSLYAIGRALHIKARAALMNGVLQMLFGVLILVEVMRRALTAELPEPLPMTVISVLALLVNTVSYVLLTRFRGDDINLRATWICSRNDMLHNISVIVAAGLVYWLGASWPDRVLALVMAAIVLRSAWHIMRESWPLVHHRNQHSHHET